MHHRLLPLLVLIAACSGGEAESLAPCLEAQGDEATLARCGEVFEATGAPRAAAAAAWAAQAQGKNDQALGWIERIPRQQVPAGLWSLAANLYLQTGDTAKAQAAYEADLPLQEAAGDHAAIARAHYGLGFLAWRRTAYGPALEHFGAALEEAGRAGDSGLVGLATQGLVADLTAIGDLEGAERMLDRAEQLLAPGDAPGDDGTRALLLANRSNLLLERGLTRVALPLIERALELSASARPPASDPGLARTLHLLWLRAALNLGDLPTAENHLVAATELVTGPEPPTSLAYYRAVLAGAQGRHADAAAQLRWALDNDPEPDWRWSLEDELGLRLEALGDREGARAAYSRAIDVLEDMRRELALDDLKAWLLERKRHPFEALFRLAATKNRPLAALDAAERAKARSFLDAFVRSAQVDPAQPLATAASRVDALRHLLPSLAASPTAALRDPERLLAATAGCHVLYYFQAEQDLWLLIVADRRLALRKLGPVADIARHLGAALADPDGSRGPGEAWSVLGSTLLPAGALPAAGRPFWIVPDGILGRLPFSALPIGNEPLAAHHAVAYLPSLNSLAVARDASGAQSAGRARVLGDPTGDLPQAAAEAREVAARLGVQPLLGAQARRSALGPGAMELLHLAAHSGTGAEGPWVELADGRVTAAEILALPLAPRLAVLATCAAADGPSRDLWGSLAAAFLAAGSRSVLASLWSLDDFQGRQLVGEFYAAGGADDPAQAVARLQRESARSGRPPSIWAPLVVFGGVSPKPEVISMSSQLAPLPKEEGAHEPF